MPHAFNWEWTYVRQTSGGVVNVSKEPSILGPILVSANVGARSILIYDQFSPLINPTPDAAKLILTIDIAATKIPPINIREWIGTSLSEGLIIVGVSDQTTCWRPSP